MTEFRSLACRRSEVSVKLVRSIQTASGSAASRPAMTSPATIPRDFTPFAASFIVAPDSEPFMAYTIVGHLRAARQAEDQLKTLYFLNQACISPHAASACSLR